MSIRANLFESGKPAFSKLIEAINSASFPEKCAFVHDFFSLVFFALFSYLLCSFISSVVVICSGKNHRTQERVKK